MIAIFSLVDILAMLAVKWLEFDSVILTLSLSLINKDCVRGDFYCQYLK